MDAPRDNLTRQVDFTVTRNSDDSDGLTLEGYAAVFNSPTLIDSWEGRFEEVIAPGAFKRTIDRKGARGIKLQFDHGQHPLIGSIPIGAIQDIREDQRGLFISARLFDNDLVKPVRDAIAGEAINGMSFRFRVVNDRWDHEPDTPVRTLGEVELFEAGPVVFPAYESTSVGVRARQIAADLKDPDFRLEVIRALVTVGPSTEPDPSGPSVEPASNDDDSAPATRRDRTGDHLKVVGDIQSFLTKRNLKDSA